MRLNTGPSCAAKGAALEPLGFGCVRKVGRQNNYSRLRDCITATLLTNATDSNGASSSGTVTVCVPHQSGTAPAMTISTTRPRRKALRRALAAALLLLASCAWQDYLRPSKSRLRAINGYETLITSPHFAGPDPSPPPRAGGELFFGGHIIRRPNEPETIIWRSRQPDGLPAHLTLAPGESRVVIDTAYVPPKGALALTGGLCARVYGWEFATGIGVRRPER